MANKVTIPTVFVHVGLTKYPADYFVLIIQIIHTLLPPVGLKGGFKESVACSFLEDDSCNQHGVTALQ